MENSPRIDTQAHPTPSLPPSKMEKLLYMGILLCVILAAIIGAAIIKIQGEKPPGLGQKILLTDPAGGSPIPFEYEGTLTPQYDEGPTPLPDDGNSDAPIDLPLITPESP